MQNAEIRAAIDEAVACFKAGDFARAEGIYRRIVSNAPNASLLADLGIICKKQGKFDEATTFLERAVELEPRSSGHHYKLAEVLFQRGDADAAFRSWSRVIELDPRHADALSWVGCVHLEAGRIDNAIARFQQAIAANPRHYHAHDNLGIALRKRGELDEAIQWHRRAIALNPDLPEAHDHLGSTLAEMDRIEEAIASHRQAVTLKPAYAAGHSNLATAYVLALRLDDAIASFHRALEVEPANPSVHWNYSNALLLAGRFDEGWKEYEWRWQAPELKKSKPAYAGPEWRGEDLTGKTLLLYGEQGFGDVLQFVRYAAMARERGANVLLVPQPELARLLATVPGVSRVIVAGDPLPAYDFHVSLLSLPFLFRTRLESIPRSVPYLSADKARVQSWRARLENSRALKAGLIWGGRKSLRFDRLRSCALSDFAPLARVEGVDFYSLQTGEQAVQAGSPPSGMSLTDWTGELADFADTAALMENLDLVISVDTAGAHLAGALGKPTWLLNRYQTEWRWLLDREDSPWYPTMRIFRQPKPGGWKAVMEQVAGELKKQVRERRA